MQSEWGWGLVMGGVISVGVGMFMVLSTKPDRMVSDEMLLAAKLAYKNRLPGGLSDNKQPTDFNSAQLKKGIAVELEHTSDPGLAIELAMDHLVEHPKYYDRLLRAGL